MICWKTGFVSESKSRSIYQIIVAVDYLDMIPYRDCMTRKKAIRRVKSKVGQKIKAARESRGLSQSQLASLCGMHITAISIFESGRREPLLSSVQRIADALSITIDELVK